MVHFPTKTHRRCQLKIRTWLNGDSRAHNAECLPPNRLQGGLQR
jgi:hypothetical protein